MFKSVLKKLPYFVLGAGLLLPQTLFAATPEFDVNFQSVYTGPHVFNVEIAQPWIKEIAEQTNNVFVPHYFMGGSLTKPEETVPSLMKGTLDMSGGGTSYNPEIFPLASQLAMPYSTKDAIHSSKLFRKIYDEVPEVKKEIDSVGKLLAIWGSDRSGLFSTKGPVRSINDIKGKRVLIWSGNQVDLIKSWGGIPVQVNPNDTYVALQRGMGEIFFGPLPTGVANKLMEVAKDISVINGTVIPVFVWMNQELWDELPPDVQKTVETSVNTWGPRTGEGLVRATNKDIETMKAAGCNIYFMTEEEIEPFKTANMPVVRDYVAKEFKRLGINKNPDEWIQFIYDTAESIK